MGRREVDILVIVLAVARISIYSWCVHYEMDHESLNKIPCWVYKIVTSFDIWIQFVYLISIFLT